MVIKHNLSAQNANRMFGQTTKAKAKNMEKLASGYKINRAADDAAGLSVSEVLDIKVFYNSGYSVDANGNLVVDSSVAGEPYSKDYNDAFVQSGLLISGSTQGSGRLILAVQDALTK